MIKSKQGNTHYELSNRLHTFDQPTKLSKCNFHFLQEILLYQLRKNTISKLRRYSLTWYPKGDLLLCYCPKESQRCHLVAVLGSCSTVVLLHSGSTSALDLGDCSSRCHVIEWWDMQADLPRGVR